VRKNQAMEVEKILESLSHSSKCNDGLDVLYDIHVERIQEFVDGLTGIILFPERIKDTNSFGSLLGEFAREEFIPPLIKVISQGVPGESKWLADYLYALIKLLEYEWEGSEELVVEEDFVHLLGDWILSTGGGEISWKAATVLSRVEHQASRSYFLKGAVSESLFHMTRVECLRGVVNYFRDDARELLEILTNDKDQHVKDAAMGAQSFLEGKRSK
jgi:hypothetical protein